MHKITFFIVLLAMMALSALSLVAQDTEMDIVNESVQVIITDNKIRIPALNVNVSIVPIYQFIRANGVSTWEASHLYYNVGHLEGTSWFGQGGNVVLGGHSAALRGGRDVFYFLHTLQPGSEIFVSADGQDYRYVVTTVTSVHKRDLGVIAPTNDDRLTLMASDLRTPHDENGVYEGRVIVVAHRQDLAQADIVQGNPEFDPNAVDPTRILIQDIMGASQ